MCEDGVAGRGGGVVGAVGLGVWGCVGHFWAKDEGLYGDRFGCGGNSEGLKMYISGFSGLFFSWFRGKMSLG